MTDHGVKYATELCRYIQKKMVGPLFLHFLIKSSNLEEDLA